jgi:hypothetical protein
MSDSLARGDTMIRQRRETAAFWRTAGLFGLLTVAFVVCISFSVGGAWFANAVDDLGELVAALVAAGACAAASRRVGSSRRGWSLMAWSSLSWACGEAIWSYYDLIRGVELPSPSAADLGFLAAVPLAVIGLRKLARRRSGPGIQLGSVFGGILMGGAVLMVIWALTLLRDPRGNELLQRLVGLAYPLGDLIMASVVLSAAARGTVNRATMQLVMAGIIAFTVADTWFAVVVTIGDFGMPYWLDTGWVLGYFLVALGAMRSLHGAAWMTPRTSSDTNRSNAAWHGAGSVPAATLTAAPSTTRVVARKRSTQHWLATANAGHIVNYTAMVLIAVDASVVLYDLGSILKMLS